MTLFTLEHGTLDAPLRGLRDDNSQPLTTTLRDALGSTPTLVAFIRHLG